MSRTWRPHRKILAVAAAVSVVAIGALAMPRTPELSQDSSGDAALIAQVEELLAQDGGVRHHLSVAVIDDGVVTVAHFGADDDTTYEVGSVTKTMTAELLVQAIDMGEVTPTTRLGDLLDLGDSAVADATLESLATHHSGLPRVNASSRQSLRALLVGLRADDPYGSTLEQLADDARKAELGEATFQYSNFGYALLGQALAAAAGMTYNDLIQERIFDPLGMTSATLPTTPDQLSGHEPLGYTGSGRVSDPWTMGADAPAGGVRATLSDMIAYAEAHVDGTAAGVDATESRVQLSDQVALGYAWFLSDGVVSHDGSTGGFSSWVGFDPAADRAVVILNDTSSDVYAIGFALLGEN